MEKHGVYLFLVVLPLAAISSALPENKQSHVAVGDKLTLTLVPPVSEPITRILWKHRVNLVAEWTNGEFTYYGTFKGHTTLDTNGRLEITNAGKAESGVYEVEVNNKVQDQRYDVIVIEKVPKPSVWFRPVACNRNSDNCTVICGAITTDAEPVSYSWNVGHGDSKNMAIGTETEDVESFHCLLKNPVSEEKSDPVANPFFEKKPSGSTVLWVVLGVLLALVGCLIGLAYWKKDFIKSRFRPLGGNITENSDNRKATSTEMADSPLGESAPLNQLNKVDSSNGQSGGEDGPGTSDEKAETSEKV